MKNQKNSPKSSRDPGERRTYPGPLADEIFHRIAIRKETAEQASKAMGIPIREVHMEYRYWRPIKGRHTLKSLGIRLGVTPLPGSAFRKLMKAGLIKLQDLKPTVESTIQVPGTKGPKGTPMSYGPYILAARLRKNLPSSVVARALGISPMVLTDWEKEEGLVPLKRIPKLCRVLGVPSIELRTLLFFVYVRRAAKRFGITAKDLTGLRWKVILGEDINLGN